MGVGLMRESTLMWLQYMTGLAILVLGALHFASLTFLGVSSYDEALTYEVVSSRYRDIFWALSLELFLVLLCYHVFNGFRIILLEIRQDKTWTKAVNVVVFLAGLAVFLYGTRTIVLFLLGAS